MNGKKNFGFKMSDKLDNFKKLLDSSHRWPCYYTFKFIVPKGVEDTVLELFHDCEVSVKDSAKGNYQSLTIKVFMKSSDEVILVYQKVSMISGVISL